MQELSEDFRNSKSESGTKNGNLQIVHCVGSAFVDNVDEIVDSFHGMVLSREGLDVPAATGAAQRRHLLQTSAIRKLI